MIEFALPWLFLLLPLPLLLRFLPAVSRLNSHHALSVPFFALLKQLPSTIHQAHASRQWLNLLLSGLIWLLLLTAASNPLWLGDPLPTPLAGRNIILAVDLSGSMSTPDMGSNSDDSVDRLDVVKAEARKFIAARSGDRLGLVLFGTKAYIQTPLTYDHQTVLNMLNDASIGLAGTQTAMGDAMGLAIKQLLATPARGRAIILLTDGGNNAGATLPLTAAEFAKQAHIHIYTVGLGASQWVVQSIFGPEVIHPTDDLDLKTLKQIALETGGAFFRAENQYDLEKVYQSINRLEPIETAKQPYRPKSPLYPYPLAAALVLAAILLLRKEAL